MSAEQAITNALQEDLPRVALALGGGAARGLAHIGVLEVFERERIAPSCIVGSSMGGLIGALYAAGATAPELREIARNFHFPRWFVPGALVAWASIFPDAARRLEHSRSKAWRGGCSSRPPISRPGSLSSSSTAPCSRASAPRAPSPV